MTCAACDAIITLLRVGCGVKSGWAITENDIWMMLGRVRLQAEIDGFGEIPVPYVQ